jgi:hypothetical protein
MDPLQSPLVPLPSEKSPGVSVLLFGVGTSAATLAAVSLLGLTFEGFHPMGWYANYVLPVGALLVGLIAGCGYGIGSWMTGARVHRHLLVTVVVVQIAVYFAFQYVEFWLFVRPQAPIPFTTYFDLATRSFAWSNHGKPGNPLGAWGYGIRLLEIAGFAAGGVIAPAILLRKPYCDRCGVYQRTREVGLVPAGVLPKKIGKKDTAAQEAYQKEVEAAFQLGQKAVELLVAAANQGDAAAFLRLLAECGGKKRDVDKLTTRLKLTLDRCPRCYSGTLVVTLVSGFGEKMTSETLVQGEVPAAFVQEIDSRLRA